MIGDSKLYFECHITIEPVFEGRLELAQIIAKHCKFQVAELLMQKRKEDTQERSKDDTFMTSRHKNYEVLAARMAQCIQMLKACEFKVWRYKIEDTIIDSKIEDKECLLSQS